MDEKDIQNLKGINKRDPAYLDGMMLILGAFRDLCNEVEKGIAEARKTKESVCGDEK